MSRVCAVMLAAILIHGAAPAVAGPGDSPNFVPEMGLSYTDPVSGERVECGDACRRFEVPAGVDLELQVRVLNMGGTVGSDGVSWDLWFDQRRYPFPGIDIADCDDPVENRLDTECWQALVNRVDWESWDSQTADRVCVPEKAGDCDEVTIWVPMEMDHDGSRGRGVYSFAVWIDRFRVHAEKNEFDNFVGPVRVKVAPASAPPPVAELREDAGSSSGDRLVVPSLPKPYTVRVVSEEKEIGFTLSSPRSRTVLEFEPQYAGNVTVEVQPSGVYEALHVEIRKVSTGEILFEVDGKGILSLEGGIGTATLKDDRRIEAVVTPAQGSRGTRGTISVSYPARAMYRRTE
jgi:hypothetical protein